ncbi:hypothetical protein [Geothrix paludis]|uniref:hypothetical protein n=1 Tax=Geothrix paludis TaxID=2922722 RepID=UPI001FADD9A6|nr:hypothetical protein [Geothrix paludis]
MALENPSQSNKKNYAWIFFAAIVVGLSAFFKEFVLPKSPHTETSKASLHEMLQKASLDTNRKCPIVGDDPAFKLVSTEVGPNDIFVYNIVINFDSKQIDNNGFVNEYRPKLINAYQNSPQMKFFKENKVKLNYNYESKNGIPIAVISISPEDSI